MFWSSELIPDGALTTDTPPDNITNTFRAAISHLNDNNQSENHVSKLNELLFDLIGCLIYNRMNSKAIFSLFSLCNFASIELGQEILTDVVWYWGTQVTFFLFCFDFLFFFIITTLTFFFYFVNRFHMKLVVEMLNPQKDGKDCVFL